MGSEMCIRDRCRLREDRAGHAGRLQGGRGRPAGGRSRPVSYTHLTLPTILLVYDSEPLLLIDDHQAEIPEADIRRQETMGPYQNIDLSLPGLLDRFLLLEPRTKAAQNIDGDGETGHSVAKRPVVLLGQQGGGDKDGHLPATFDRLEGGPHGQLGLPVADIAADQPIHWPGLLHVLLDRYGHLHLVLSIVKRKGRLELALPFAILFVGETLSLIHI